MPKTREGFYRDTAVVAYRTKAEAPPPSAPELTASSAQPGHAPGLARDGDADTYWVSAGTKPGEGPTPEHPEWIQLRLSKPVRGLMLSITGRSGYGPKECELQLSSDGNSFRSERRFSMEDGQAKVLRLEDTNAAFVRVVVLAAYDRGSPDAPRNVQISEVAFSGKDHPMASRRARRFRIGNRRRFTARCTSRRRTPRHCLRSFRLSRARKTPGPPMWWT